MQPRLKWMRPLWVGVGRTCQKRSARILRAGELLARHPLLGSSIELRGIHAQVVSSTSAKNLQGCIRDNAGEAAAIYTDGQRAYIGLELTSSTRRSITAPENRYAGSCIPRVSSHFGQCLSELRWAPSTRSPPSILIAMSGSLPEGTTFARKTPSTSWQLLLRAQ